MYGQIVTIVGEARVGQSRLVLGHNSLVQGPLWCGQLPGIHIEPRL
jgi:hypothetical protein